MQFKLTKEMTKRNTALIKDYSSLSSGKQRFHAGGSSHSGFYFQLKRPVFILIFLNVLYHEYKNSSFQGNPGTYFIESAILMYTGCSVSASAILLFIFCCEEKKKTSV